MPRSHRRQGAPCGPFAPVSVAPAGALITARVQPTRPETYRQSLLRSFEVCPRRALHEIQLPGDLSVGNVESSADLGSATHAVFHEILRTLRRQGEEQISTQEGIEIMYETLAAGEWVLPAEDRHSLVAFVLSFCSYYSWPRGRIMALEAKLHLDLKCPDGKTRTLTGTPDVVLADPPDGLVIVDFKTGKGQPRSPREMPEDGQPIVGREYLSSEGTFQLDVYGLLALKGVDEHGHRLTTRASRATMREAWMRFGQRREATLGLDELEHVERQIGVQMMLLDRAIEEGPESGSKLTNPRPGRQCVRGCPVSMSCPVPEEQRGEGAIGSPADADENARRWVKVQAVNTALRARLKAWHEETGHCPDVGDGTVVRWSGDKPGRKFGVHVEAAGADQRAGDEFLASMEAELARRGEVVSA